MSKICLADGEKAITNSIFNYRSKARQESDLLKSYLKKAQDDIVALLDEKRKLLDTVRNLQVSICDVKSDEDI